MYDLSSNTELKNETFNIIQKPKIKFFWKDGKVEESDRSRFLKSASGSIEMQNIEREATKNQFDIVLENTDNDPTSPGTWFPENSLSNGENVRIEVGYEHAGVGAETITLSRGVVRQLVGTTDTKSSTLSALDNGKDFDKEITLTTFFKTKKPYEIITSICSELGYLTSNPVGSKKLVIKTDINGDTDESFMNIKYYAITERFAWEVINEICETSLGRFFINRNGDAEYWTFNYWSNKFSEDNKTPDFVASVYKIEGEETMPMLSHSVDCSYGNMVNSTEIGYNIFTKKENYDGDQFNFELSSGETDTFEIDISGYIETLDTNYNVSWIKSGFLDEDYQGTNYGVDLDILTVVNNYNKLTVTIKNNNGSYLYCYLQPRIVLGYTYKTKTIKKKESDALFAGGTENFNKNKETKKSISGNIISNKVWADNIALKYIELYRNPQRTTTFKTTGFPQVDLGDIIKTQNAIETKNKVIYGWVNKIDWTFDTDGFLMTLMLYVMSSANSFSIFILDEFLNLDLTSLMQDLQHTGTSIKLRYEGSGADEAKSTNGWFIVDRFGSLLNQAIANDRTDIGTSGITQTGYSFNKQAFKTIKINENKDIKSTNGNYITERFGSLLNQTISDDRTDLVDTTNVQTGYSFNKQAFKSLKINTTFTVIK